MLLTALLDGERVDATKHTAASWAELQESDDRKRMVLPLCGIRAVPRRRGASTRYFAHYSTKDCKSEHGGETPQHLAMKEALQRCIDGVPGWHAVVEHSHPSREWTIDVLAESDDHKRGVAFEVQLSPQTQDEYFSRSQRYFNSNFFPVWLIPRQLEPHPIKVPVVVTGFGKSSEVPDDVSDLLSLPAVQDFLIAEEKLGTFVETLLRRGPTWKHGTPAHQVAVQKAAAEAAAGVAEAERLENETLKQTIEEMNDQCASPESAFGPHTVHTYNDTFVWATLTRCWNCEEPMLVWDARRPRFRQKWAQVPEIEVKQNVSERRIEDQAEVRRAVDAWAKAAQSDIPTAAMKLRRTKASGRLYNAFVCPSCDSTMGQFFISQIRAEKWSVISGPTLEPQKPASVPQPSVAAPAPARRCRIHSALEPWCDWCQGRPEPRLGKHFFRRE